MREPGPIETAAGRTHRRCKTSHPALRTQRTALLLFGDLDAAGAGRGGPLLVLVLVAAVGACAGVVGFALARR
jgi:hypothetical protein